MAAALGKNLIDELNPQERQNLVVEVSDTTLFEMQEHQDRMNHSEDAYRYLAGEQYLPAQKEWFLTNDRPVRAFNLIFPRINQIMGDFLLNNMKRKVFPLPGGDGKTSELFQKLLDQHYSEDEIKSQLLVTALAGICNMGFASPRIDTLLDLEGKLTVKNDNEFEVLFDSRSLDSMLDDATYMIKFRKLDPMDIIHGWPEHETKLRELFQIRDKTEEMAAYLDHLGPRERKLVFHPDLFDRVEGRYTVVEYHKMEWRRKEIFTDLLTGVSEPWPYGESSTSNNPLDARKKEFFLKLHPIHKIETRKFKTKVITSCIPAHHFILDRYEAPLQDNTFDIIKFSFYPYGKRAVADFGVFKNAKEAQDSFNEHENKKQDILLKQANPGFMYRPEMLENPQDVEQHSSRPGQNYAIKAAAPSLDDAMKTNDFNRNSQAMSQLTLDGSELLDKVMGMSANFLFGSTQTSNENASLFAQRIQQAQVSFQIGYNQWARFNKRLDNKNIKLMQLFYTTERVVMITTPFNSDPKAMILNAQVAGRVINDISRGKYETTVDETNRTPTMRLVQFQLKSQLLNQLASWLGPAVAQVIPWEWYLGDAIDLGDVQPLIDNLNGFMQAQGVQAEEDEALNKVTQLLDGARQQLDLQQMAGRAIQGEQPQNGGTNGQAAKAPHNGFGG